MNTAIGFHLIESTLFSAVVGIFVFVFQKCGASFRYALWLAAVAKFLIPVTLFAMLGIRFGSLLPSEYSPMAGAASFPVRAYRALNAPAASLAHPHSTLLTAIGVLWISGILLTLGIWIRRFLTFHESSDLPVEREQAVLERLRQHLRIRKAVRLRLTGGESELALWGIWRPSIRIPQGLSSQLTPIQFDSVLLHELIHVRRWDNLASGFVHVVVCVFWFHPFLWWVERRLIVERERACDEMVVQSGVEPETYAAAILKVCRFQLGHVIAGASGISGSDLNCRMELIMSNDSKNANAGLRRVLLTALASVMTLVPFAIGFLQQPTLRAQQSSTSVGSRACRYADVEYPQGTVLQMGTISSSPKKVCVQGSWQKTNRAATAVAKDSTQRPAICKPQQSTSPKACICGGVEFSLGAMVNTPDGAMRCDKFVLGQFTTWRAVTSSDLGRSQ